MEDNKYVIPKRKSIYLSLFLFLVFFSWGFFAFAYSPYYTHPDLTEEIINLWNLKNDNQVREISKDEIQWMRKGAIEEDKPARWINHFYDPVHKTGWSGKHFGTLSQEEGLWEGESMSPMPAIASVDWVVNQEYQATYGRQYGNQTWQRAIRLYIDGDRKSSFIALGHVLHLIEDMSVPDHTRDDTHADIYGDPGSPYENYSQEYTNLHELVIANELSNEDLLKFDTIQSSFEYLANYSNTNFFSEETISNEEFGLPNLKNLKKIIKNIEGEEKKVLFDSQRQIHLAFLEDSDIYTIKDKSLILPSYFSSLSSQAVLTGASVLDLFFREVEKYKQNPQSLPEIVPDSYEALSSYLKKSPRLVLVNGKNTFDRVGAGVKIYANTTSNFISDTISSAGNTLSSAYDSAKTAISSVVKIDITRSVGDFSKNQTASLLDAVGTGGVVEGPVLAGDSIQGESLNGVSSDIPSGAVATPTSNTIQGHALDGKNQSVISQTPVFVGGAMPIVAAPAPVVASQSQTTPAIVQEEQPVVQDPISEVPATTTPEIVLDITAPVITILGDNPTMVLVGGHYTELGATALDDTDGSRTVSASSSVNVFTEGDYLVSYTASDLSGNVAHATRTVSVVPTLATFSFSDLNNNGIADSDEADVLVDMSTALPAGEYRFNNLTIASSSALTLQGDPSSLSDFKGVKIVAQNITVDVGSSIFADYQGYKINGPGSPSSPAYLAGASYGGVGTGGGVPPYGDALTPTELGSNGGVCCGNFQGGGGAMHFIVSGTFLNNGTVSANGSGSSSGGSIYGVMNALAGSGTFQANGGAHSVSSVYHGRGGGGRTALYYQTSSFNGASTALGGCSSFGMGYPYECAGNGTAVLFDTKNNDLYVSSSWRFSANEGPFNFNRIVVTDGASVEVEDGVHLSAHELSVAGASTFSITGSSVINIPRISVDDNSTLTFSGKESLTLDTLSVTENSTISVTQGSPLFLHVQDLTISANSKINLDNKGYSGGVGPGAPIEFYDGASHGGVGYNNSATSTYGLITEPIEMGSGGNGHHTYAQGGGALKIIADGTFVLDGVVSARGGITSSGGSIYIIAHRLTGSGQIVADGGVSYWQGQYIGPGGGGRIAVTAEQYAFVGSMSALGGCVSFDGWTLSCAGNGTIENSNELEQLVVDEEVPVQEEENVTPVVQDTTPPIITIGAYDSTTATSTPITVTATTSEGVLNAESHTFAENGSFDFVAIDDAGNTTTTTVTIENIDTTPPSITSYTLNDSEGNVEMIVSAPSSVTFVLHANENVDWVSLRIEHSEDTGIYKTFYSGTGCSDGTTVCTKVWDTSLSKGDFIQGTYRIKAHVRDAVGNDVTEYLEPYVIIVQGEPV